MRRFVCLLGICGNSLWILDKFITAFSLLCLGYKLVCKIYDIGQFVKFRTGQFVKRRMSFGLSYFGYQSVGQFYAISLVCTF